MIVRDVVIGAMIFCVSFFSFAEFSCAKTHSLQKSVGMAVAQCEDMASIRVLVVMELPDPFGGATPAGYRTQAACYDLKNRITQWLCDADDQHYALLTECLNAIRIKNMYGVDISAQAPKVFGGDPNGKNQLLFGPDPLDVVGRSEVKLYLLSPHNKDVGEARAKKMRGKQSAQCSLHPKGEGGE